MKNWINEHLILNNKLISKRCRRAWFVNNGCIQKYNDIIQITMFLPSNTLFTERLYNAYNGITKLQYCNTCSKTLAKFKSFNLGYSYCSNKCAQNSNTVKDQIKKNNLKKFGKDYYTQTDMFKHASKQTWLDKYGVDNPSKSNIIKDKKIQSCISHHGVEYPQQSYTIRKKSIITNNLKYGVDNPMLCGEIKNKSQHKRLLSEYNRFFNQSDIDFPTYIIPNFNKTKYTGINYEYEFTCKRCNNNFTSILRGGKIPRCYSCFPNNNTSKMEIELGDYIESLGMNVIRNDKTILNGQELDIYIPDFKLAIEFNGLYYHSEQHGKSKQYHLNKTKNCESLGIRLIHIFEDEWLNKQAIIKSRLKNIIETHTYSIFGRKTSIVELSTEEARNFLETTHLQGYSPNTVKLGLKYENKLISVMTFAKRKIFKNTEWEIVRYATNTSVIGGFDKLLSHFVNKHNPDKIISYALRTWTNINSNIYQQSGFTLKNNGQPNYFYIINNQRINRINFQKHKLKYKLKIFNPNLTEWQNMKNNGYDRIWDCGSLKYEKTF